MRRGIDTGFTASAAIMPGIVNSYRSTIVKGDPKEHPFYMPLKNYPRWILTMKKEID